VHVVRPRPSPRPAPAARVVCHSVFCHHSCSAIPILPSFSFFVLCFSFPCSAIPMFCHHSMFSFSFPCSVIPMFYHHSMFSLLRNPNEGLCGQIPNIALRAIASLYIEHVPLIWNRDQKEARGPTIYSVSRVFPLSCLWEGRRVLYSFLRLYC
jgi:hypothetical protein